MDRLPPIRELAAAIQPDPTTEKVWYAKYVIRKVSILFTWILLHTPMTANQATVLQALLGIGGAILLAFGGYTWAILAVILIQLGYIFDCVDGEIARFRKKPSINGIFLDSLNHAIVIPFLFLGLSIFTYTIVLEAWVLYVGAVLATVSGNPVKKGILSTISYMLERKNNEKYRLENLTREVGDTPSDEKSHAPEQRHPHRIGRLIYAIAKDISEYPTSMNVITIAVIADVLLQANARLDGRPISLYVVVFYAVFLLLKEIFFFSKTFAQRGVERKFLKFIR